MLTVLQCDSNQIGHSKVILSAFIKHAPGVQNQSSVNWRYFNPQADSDPFTLQQLKNDSGV